MKTQNELNNFRAIQLQPEKKTKQVKNNWIYCNLYNAES